MFDPARRVQHRLGGGHRKVQEEVVVVVDELQHFGGDRRLVAGRHHCRSDGPVKERCGGAIAVVDLVAHVERLGDEVLEVDAAQLRYRLLQDRVEGVPHPVQPLNDWLTEGAVAQDLTQPFVKRGVGRIAMRLVLEDEHRHGGRDNACHRPDRGMFVAGGELDGAGGGEPSGCLSGCGLCARRAERR